MAFHGREGFSTERIEIAVAQLATLVKSAVAKKGTRVSMQDFLPFSRAWEDLEAELDPVKHEIAAFKKQFASAGIAVVTRKRA